MLSFAIICCIWFGCSMNNTNSNIENIQSDDIENIQSDDIDKDYSSILGRFRQINLPIELNTSNNIWIDFNNLGHQTRIERDTVIKYFFLGDTALYRKSYYYASFYYGYYCRFGNGSIGLFYYYSSSDDNGMNGYKLIVLGGEQSDPIMLSGSSGVFDPDRQLESVIENDKIVTREFKWNLEDVQDGSNFEGEQRSLEYRILPSGKIEKVKETPFSKTHFKELMKPAIRIVEKE